MSNLIHDRAVTNPSEMVSFNNLLKDLNDAKNHCIFLEHILPKTGNSPFSNYRTKQLVVASPSVKTVCFIIIELSLNEKPR